LDFWRGPEAYIRETTKPLLGTVQSFEPLVDYGCRSGDPPQYSDVTTAVTECTGTEGGRLCRQRKLMQIVFAGPVPVREEVGATECLPSGDLGTIPRRGASDEARKATTDVLYGSLSVDDPGRCDDRRDAAMVTADILNSLIHVWGQLPNSLAYSTPPTKIFKYLESRSAVRLRTCLRVLAAREKPPSSPRDNMLVLTNLVSDYLKWSRTGKSGSPFCPNGIRRVSSSPRIEKYLLLSRGIAMFMEGDYYRRAGQ
jgi:hypothetical protein